MVSSSDIDSEDISAHIRRNQLLGHGYVPRHIYASIMCVVVIPFRLVVDVDKCSLYKTQVETSLTEFSMIRSTRLSNSCHLACPHEGKSRKELIHCLFEFFSFNTNRCIRFLESLAHDPCERKSRMFDNVTSIFDACFN